MALNESTNEVSDDSKLDFTFEFAKSKFSELTDEKFWSPNYSVADVTWKACIKKNVVDSEEELAKTYLSVYVFAQGESKLWCCYARINLTLLSQKEGVVNITRKMELVFSSLNSNRGYPKFEMWNFLIDPENGYIKDDTVRFQVHIVADFPHNADPNFVKDEPVKFKDWLSVFEDEINKKMVSRICEEFKKVVSSMDEGFKGMNRVINDNMKNIICSADNNIHIVNNNISSVKEEIGTVQEVIDTVHEYIGTAGHDIGTVKQDICSLKDDVSSVHSGVDELKNLLVKRKENNDINLKRQNFENRISCDVSPSCGNNKPFLPPDNCGDACESESDRQLFVKVNVACYGARDQFTVQNKCTRKELERGTSSSSLTPQHLEVEKSLEKNDRNESDSTDPTHSLLPCWSPRLSNSSFTFVDDTDFEEKSGNKQDSSNSK